MGIFSPPRPSDAKGLIVLILCAGVLLGGVAYLLFAYSETLYAPPPEGKTSKPKRIKKSAPDTEPDKWAALDEYLDGIAASGNYTFRHAPYAGWNTMIMDKDGALLRLVSMIYSWPTGIEVTSEYQIEVSRIIRVDLLNYESKEARYNTITEGKSSRDGVLVRATIGGLLFGPAGAVVGAMSAGSSNTAASVTTVGESVRYEGSELVISVSDIAHPVIRFLSRNQSESETWLYRIRAAMAKYSQKADI